MQNATVSGFITSFLVIFSNCTILRRGFIPACLLELLNLNLTVANTGTDEKFVKT